jgi:CRISPR system Cascade subunit CasE
VFLSKLTFNVQSREFRRDLADVHDMHRTVMSAFSQHPNAAAFRQAHNVLWRLDPTGAGYLQYVQSDTEPDWTKLPTGHLTQPAEVRSLQPVLDAVRAGGKYSFRLVANPTRCVHDDERPEVRKRVPLTDPERQFGWLVGKGDQNGFVIPSARGGGPDVTFSALPRLIGKRHEKAKITINAVRFDGHLVVTDAEAFTAAIATGVGRAKAYGCGLFSLARPRT